IQAQRGCGDGLPTYNIPLPERSRPTVERMSRKNKKSPGKSSENSSKKSLTNSNFETSAPPAKRFSPRIIVESSILSEPRSTTHTCVTTVTTTSEQTTQQSIPASTNFGTLPRPSTSLTTQATCRIIPDPQSVSTCAQKANLSETSFFKQSAITCNQQKDKSSVLVFDSSVPTTSNTPTNPTGSVTQSRFSNTSEPDQKQSLSALESFRFTLSPTSMQKYMDAKKSNDIINQNKTPSTSTTSSIFNPPGSQIFGARLSSAQTFETGQTPFWINQTFGANQISQTPFGMLQTMQPFGANQIPQQIFGANHMPQTSFEMLQTMQPFGTNQTPQQIFGANQIPQTPVGMLQTIQPFGTNQIPQQIFGANQISQTPVEMLQTVQPFGANQTPQ
ncbi:hypothetical protein Trydic_g9994, partial [Trypoxylus dichotomus]